MSKPSLPPRSAARARASGRLIVEAPDGAA
jgi:hypothetical protein